MKLARRLRFNRTPPCVLAASTAAQHGRRRHGTICRRGFTLIELLVAIVVIGILTGLSLGALGKAQTRGKMMKTQSTITKLHQQIMTKWESYKFRRAPVDAKLLLTGGGTQQTNALAFINQLWVNRGSSATDPLGAGFAGSSLPTSSFPTTAQLSAAKLLIMRELQRYEMPTGWSDIIDTDTAGVFQGSAGNWTMRTPQVLVTVPQLAWAYLQRVNRAVDASGQPLTQVYFEESDAAECLYQIVKLACEDENVDLASSVKEVGDADGDGLPEFQDAFTGMDRNYVTNAPANNPIMRNRWPAGFTNLNLADASGNFKESFYVSD